MQKNSLQITAGVFEIIAGALWLMDVLYINQIANLFGLSLDTMQILMPIAIVISGIRVCTGKLKRSDFITLGIVNLGAIGVQFYFEKYAGFGVIPMVLLFIASILYFFIKNSKTESVKSQKHNTNVDSNSVNKEMIIKPQESQSAEDDISAKLIKLEKLFNTGIITEQEYQSERTKLINKMFE